MNAGTEAFRQASQNAIQAMLDETVVCLYGAGNTELNTGGYAPQPYADSVRFVFTGATPMIHGFWLMRNGQCEYGESFNEPWRALNAGDAIEIDLSVTVKVKHG